MDPLDTDDEYQDWCEVNSCHLCDGIGWEDDPPWTCERCGGTGIDPDAEYDGPPPV